MVSFLKKRHKKRHFRHKEQYFHARKQEQFQPDFSNNPQNLKSDYEKIGRIVERVNFVELQINRIIAEFYVPTSQKNIFLEDFMFAGRLRMNDKLKIFRTILERKGIASDPVIMEKWIHIRNMVAHGVPLQTKNSESVLQFNGGFYNIDSQFRDFEKLQAKMEALIQKI